MSECRPWGSYQVIARGDGFQVKILRIDPGQRTSRQRHKHRAESWAVVSGQAEIEINGGIARISGGWIQVRGQHKKPMIGTVSIPPNMVHRIRNPSKDIPLVIIESQAGICEESDIERLADDYGRADRPRL